jgi:alpha-ketoglutaric semialdehyde dehydrogenase
MDRSRAAAIRESQPGHRRSRGLFARGSAADIAAAADAAAGAFPAWATLNAPARGAFLFKAAEILDSRFDEVAADMTREEGKTLPEAKGEVRRAINIFRYFGGEGSRLNGMLVPSERDRVHMFAIRKPVGVVGLITPWNFPSAIPAWKLAPALICGNTVVLKPASAAPLSAWRLVQALHEAGLPKGVVNFVAGPGGELGQALVEAPPLKAISFTGSCQIGNWLHAEASKRRLRIQLEMGGKNPTIVLADADFNAAVENTVNAAFFSTGQKCTATSRAIVEDAIYDRFLDAAVERTRKLKVGDGMQPGIDIGPCVDEAQMETVLRYIDIGRREAGEPKIGGRRLTGRRSRQGIFRRANRVRRRDAGDDHRPRRNLRTRAGRDARPRFRGRPAHRQRYSVRALGFHSNHQPFARLRVRLPDGSGPAYCEPSQRRRGVSVALWRD